MKNRLRDLIGIPFNTLGEYRQAIRRVLVQAKVNEKDIENILSILAPPQTTTHVLVTSYQLPAGVIQGLPDPPFSKALKAQLAQMPATQSPEAFREAARKALSGAEHR